MALTTADLQGTESASWRAQARCAGVDVELFFTADDDARTRALELCQSCPVRDDCYRAAVERGEMHGIWGGTEASERRSRIRERRRREREAEAA